MLGDATRCPSKELILGASMISQPVDFANDCAERSLPGIKGCWVRVGDGVLLY